MYAIRSYYAEGKLRAIKEFNPQIKTTCNNQEAINEADLIILAVKPWFIKEVIEGLTLQTEKQIIASVAAGIPFAEYRITSYNVCYTKLLRTLCVLPKHIQREKGAHNKTGQQHNQHGKPNVNLACNFQVTLLHVAPRMFS